MALEDKPISWFPTAPEITPNSLLFVSTPSGNSYDSNNVPAGEFGEAIVSDFEYTQELETEDKTLTGAVNELLTYAANIAEEYDPSETYAVGDFCLHEGVLYKCTTAIPIAEAWTAAHWTSTLIVDNFGTGGGGGASVTLGTTVPSDASGSNGDLYVQYDSTSYEVIEYYVKINDSWRKTPYSRVVALTQAQYDLITPDNQTLYIITDKQGSYVKLPVITDAWDSATSYTVGSYCIHNDTLWKCTTANSNQEPTSGSTYWDDTSVADEIGRIDGELTGIPKELVLSSNSYKFGSMTWTASGSGVFYTTIDLDNILPSGAKIIAITVNGWNNIRTTDNIMPYIRTDRTIGIMSNVNTFADNNSAFGYSILYV